MVTHEQVKQAEADLLEVEAIQKLVNQRVEEKKVRYHAMRTAFKKVCTHIHPDGTSAWEGHWMYSSCNICGLDDM